MAPLCGQDWITAHKQKYPPDGTLPIQAIQILVDDRIVETLDKPPKGLIKKLMTLAK